MNHDPQNQSRTVLGADCQISGDLTIDNDATILGQFDGDLRVTRSLEVGESARVRGTMLAGALALSGEIEAVVVAEHTVTLLPGARVKGRIFARQLQIEEGAVYEGELSIGPNAVEAAEAHLRSGQDQRSALPSSESHRFEDRPVRTVPSAVATLLERRRQETTAGETNQAA